MSPNNLGRYNLIRVLGKGAMGLVYEGRDPNLDRRVAIKTIRVENLDEAAAAEYEKRFRVEARSAARLQHPNIVSVYDSDRYLDTAFLVMEFVQGDDLKVLLDRGKVFTLAQTLALMRDLLSALHYAHRHNVVHRDVKPANLLIEASGRVKLTDFGVARIEDSDDATRTHGAMVGTLKYMSPEQVKGMPIDSRSDLFAAGVVLHQLLTGQRPFEGETDFAIMRQILGKDLAAPSHFNPQLPAALDAVVAKALAKSRDDRFATAAQFATALEAACKEVADHTVMPTPVQSNQDNWDDTVQGDETFLSANHSYQHDGAQHNNTGSKFSSSAVTQELELVFWKDIKDSQDVEDIELFLVKFPSGVYAELARRRLKKLAGLLTGSSGIPTNSSSSVASARTAGAVTPLDAFSAELDTCPLKDSDQNALSDPLEAVAKPAPESAATITNNGRKDKGAGNTEETQENTATPRGVVQKLGSRKRTMLLMGGVLLTAVLLAVNLLPRSEPLTASAEPTAPPASVKEPSALPASVNMVVNVPVAVMPVPTVSAVVEENAIKPAPPVAIAGAASSPSSALAASATTQLADAVAAKKVAIKPPPAPNPKPATALKATPTEEPIEVPRTTSPRQICEKRVLLGFHFCMIEQCAKPAFAQYPECVERRVMDEIRKEKERNR